MPRDLSLRRIADALVALSFVAALATPVAFGASMEWLYGETDGPIRRPVDDQRGLFLLGEDGVLRTRPGWRGSHRVGDRTVTVRMNGLGLRGPEIRVDGDDGAARVLVIGDSFPWGFGVGDDETFPAVLESQLAGRRGGDVVVGNAGAPGRGTVDQIAIAVDYRATFRPDVVVSCVNLGNDFQDDAVRDTRIFAGSVVTGPTARFVAGSWRARLAATFQLPFFFEQAIDTFLPVWSIDRAELMVRTPAEREAERLLPPPAARRGGVFLDRIEPTAELLELGEHFDETLRSLRERVAPARLLVVLIPSLDQVMPADFDRALRSMGFDASEFERGTGCRRLAARCARLGVDCVDLWPLLQQGPRPRARWILHNRHFSVAGHRDVATWLAPRVSQLLGDR